MGVLWLVINSSKRVSVKDADPFHFPEKKRYEAPFLHSYILFEVRVWICER